MPSTAESALQRAQMSCERPEENIGSSAWSLRIQQTTTDIEVQTDKICDALDIKTESIETTLESTVKKGKCQSCAEWERLWAEVKAKDE